VMKTVLITGGSEGIGYALAELFVRDGYDVILAARNMMKLLHARERLQEISKVARIDVISIDLSVSGSAMRLYQQVRDRKIDVLVNNAGSGLTGRSWKLPIETEEQMIGLNDTALVSLTKLCLRDMTARKEGVILNVASTGAFQPGPYIAGYYASKAFVLSYSRAVREEAKPYGVSVSCLCPGPVDTGFYGKSGGKKPAYIMSPEKCAAYAYQRMGKKAVIVPGLLNRMLMIVPESWKMKAVMRMKGKNL